jgi:hypothetical protein
VIDSGPVRTHMSAPVRMRSTLAGRSTHRDGVSRVSIKISATIGTPWEISCVAEASSKGRSGTTTSSFRSRCSRWQPSKVRPPRRFRASHGHAVTRLVGPTMPIAGVEIFGRVRKQATLIMNARYEFFLC